MRRFFLYFLLLLSLAACQNEPAPATTEAPATAEAAALTPVSTDTPLPPTTSAAEPESPTAVLHGSSNDPNSNFTAESPTEIPPTPMATPIPSSPVDSVQLVPFITGGLQQPLYLTHAYDERLFVVEQAGVIKIIADGELLSEPFLDIDDRVGFNANEQGLLSVAFHPNYEENGRFFVNYTDNNGDTVVARYRVSAADPNRADPDSEEILLFANQPYVNHNGGLVKFGPDGYLYVGLGDGGSQGDPQNNGQNPNTLLGSILRLDVDTEADGNLYGIPSSNPFADGENGRGEVWAYGLRNPWRFSFDRLTGDLFIADVGQNIWEEVSFQPAGSSGGENYGWNIMEGNHCFRQNNCDPSGLILPVFEYDHSQGCSISGGYVYRGQEFPALYGNYFVADFCTGFVWRLFPQANSAWDSALINQSGLNINSFGEDQNGELYAVARTGQIYRVQP